MTATYSDLLTLDRDWLRFSIGDVDMTAPLLSDEAIDAALTRFTDRRLAGAELASGLASRFALEPDSLSVSGEITLSWRLRVQRWAGLAATWTALVGSEASGLYSAAASRDIDTTSEYANAGWPIVRYD